MVKIITQEYKTELFSNTDMPFNQCHASSVLLLSNHELLVTFFAGSKEGALDTAIWLVRGRDNHWSTPQIVVAIPHQAHWNPVLHRDEGVIWLFFKTGNDVQHWITRYVYSTDNGITWSQPRELVAESQRPFGPVKNKLLILDNGDWLAPNSIEHGNLWDAFVDRSEDHGEHWQQVPVPFAHKQAVPSALENCWQGLNTGQLWETEPDTIFQWDGIIQPSLWASSHQHVHMLLRSTRGQIYRSDSNDNGHSWCQAYPTGLPNNNSGLDVTSSVSGLFLAYNPVSGNWGKRYPLSLAHSADNGENWSCITNLESTEGEFSYPAIIASSQALHITYTANRSNIVYQKWCFTDKTEE